MFIQSSDLFSHKIQHKAEGINLALACITLGRFLSRSRKRSDTVFNIELIFELFKLFKLKIEIRLTFMIFKYFKQNYNIVKQQKRYFNMFSRL